MTNQVVSVTEGTTTSGIFWRKTTTETSGETLVLVMGYGGSLRIWPLDFVEKLAGKYCVVTYDNRGTGLSFVPAEPQDYTTALMSDDLDQVMSALNINTFHLLGYSMGACIALEYACRYAEKVKTLFLLSGSAGGAMYHKPAPEVSQALANPQGNTLWDIYMYTFALMYSPSELQRCEPALKKIYDNSKALPTSLTGLRGHSNAFKNFDVSALVSNLRMPVAVVSGTDDRLMPPQNSAVLAEAIPEARLILIPNCEHAAHIQEEARIISEIENHCR